MNMIIYPTLFTNYSELYGNKEKNDECKYGKRRKPQSPGKNLSTPLITATSLLGYPPFLREIFYPPPFRSLKKMGYPLFVKGGGAHYGGGIRINGIAQVRWSKSMTMTIIW